MSKGNRANFHTVCDDIAQTVSSYQPDCQNSYDKVSVLGVHWENDTVGVEPLMRTLLYNVFDTMYGFETEIFEIPTTANGVCLNSSQIKASFMAKFTSWMVQNQGPKNLMILYYSGHGQPTKKRSGPEAFDAFHWR